MQLLADVGMSRFCWFSLLLTDSFWLLSGLDKRPLSSLCSLIDDFLLQPMLLLLLFDLSDSLRLWLLLEAEAFLIKLLFRSFSENELVMSRFVEFSMPNN